MLGSSLGFSVMSLLVKLASSRLPAMEIVFARSVFMGVLSAGLLVRVGGSLAGNARWTLLARGVTGATALSLLYWGLGELPLGEAITVHYTAPVWTALAAAIFLGERLRPTILAGVAACMVGVVLVAQPAVLFGAHTEPVNRLAIGAVLLAAVLSGIAYTFVRKLRATDVPMTIIFYLSWVGALGTLPFALAGGWVWPTPIGWALLLGIGIATQLGQVGLTHALRLLEAGTATAIGYVQIVLAFGWGLLFLNETPDVPSLIGAVVVLGSVALIARRG